MNGELKDQKPDVFLTFDQLDVESGEYSRFTRKFFMGDLPQIKLDLNEFKNNDDYLGLFDSESDPVTTLTLGSVSYDSFLPISYGLNSPKVGVEIALGEKKKKYQRQVYSFMAALGDFGGFNDGIIMLPALFFTSYSGCMFAKSNGSELPTRKRSKSKAANARLSNSGSSQQQMVQRFIGQPLPFSLDQADTESIAAESKKTTFV